MFLFERTQIGFFSKCSFKISNLKPKFKIPKIFLNYESWNGFSAENRKWEETEFKYEDIRAGKKKHAKPQD